MGENLYEMGEWNGKAMCTSVCFHCPSEVSLVKEATQINIMLPWQILLPWQSYLTDGLSHLPSVSQPINNSHFSVSANWNETTWDICNVYSSKMRLCCGWWALMGGKALDNLLLLFPVCPSVMNKNAAINWKWIYCIKNNLKALQPRIVDAKILPHQQCKIHFMLIPSSLLCYQ